MTAAAPLAGRITRWKDAVLWLALSCYLAGRLSQLWADRLPSLLIVLLHVVPPAAFATVHGSILYGRKGMLIFTACCLGASGFLETLSLRTGFPFGRYYFTDVMGPKVFGLPFLLVLAYLGIGYCSWVMSLIILGYRNEPLRGSRAVALPVLAAFIMLAWDLAMDPAWGTIDRAWIWRDGGAFYGVPVSNFFGWYLTAYVFYQAFALSQAASPSSPATLSRSLWRGPILLYALCAAGNPLLLRLKGLPEVVVDATGKEWITRDILATCAMVSLVVMGPTVLLAWLRLNEGEQGGG